LGDCCAGTAFSCDVALPDDMVGQSQHHRDWPITDDLVREASLLPVKFRAVPDVGYQKRLLFKKDMESLIMF
jgi:hypothetical protein